MFPRLAWGRLFPVRWIGGGNVPVVHRKPIPRWTTPNFPLMPVGYDIGCRNPFIGILHPITVFSGDGIVISFPLWWRAKSLLMLIPPMQLTT